MAGTSKFIQISDQILIEYIYTDQSNPDTTEVDESTVEILTSEITGENYMFTGTDSIIETGNSRDYSTIPINPLKSEFVSLNKDLPIPYNDFDSNLTSSVNLKQNFDSPSTTDVVYDTIKIHLRSGFTFEDLQGYIFNVTVTRIDNIKINLLSILYSKNDSYENLNPKPFLVGDKLYTSYILLKIPAISFLLSPEETNPPINPDTLNSRLTSSNIQTESNPYNKTLGKGFLKTTTIDITLYDIYESYKLNGFQYFKTRENNKSSLSQKDDYNLLVAKIEEAHDGDYYNLYGEYNGEIFEDYITMLNNQQDSNYIVFHEISITEQLSTSMIETNRLTIIQSENWEKPIIFRPVIINSSNAVSYTLTYILRLINKVDNSQIIKSSQITSFDTKKYGKKMQTINLGTIPNVLKVYNKIEKQNVSLPISTSISDNIFNDSNIIVKKEYIDVFRDRINVKVSASKVKIENLKNS